MLFNWKKKQSENKELLIITPFDEKQASLICQNPNEAKSSSQIISALGELVDGEIKKDDMAFWIDDKTFDNIKPATIYKVIYKSFDSTDIRAKYPNSFCLVKLKECIKIDSDTKSIFDDFAQKERQQIEKWQKMSEEAIALQDKEFIKARDRLKEERLPIEETAYIYKNTSFDIEVDWDCFESDEDEVVVKKVIQNFLKSKDKIIDAALKSAVENELDLAKEWADNPDLTQTEFINNLLANPFFVSITGKHSYDIIFDTNDMFLDHSLVCSMEGTKCIDTTIEG